jgi:hypothetical protein
MYHILHLLYAGIHTYVLRVQEKVRDPGGSDVRGVHPSGHHRHNHSPRHCLPQEPQDDELFVHLYSYICNTNPPLRTLLGFAVWYSIFKWVLPGNF